jgi:hypothetical protein
MYEKNLRSNLLELLDGGSAHVSLKDGLSGIQPENRHKKTEPVEKTIWEHLEHMRIAQKDILDYTLSQEWESMNWPDDYWPDPATSLTESMWEKTLGDCFADLQKVKDLVNDEKVDLTSEIPWGEGRTYLRQVLLIADHNSYHISKILTVRKILKNW